MWLPSRLKLQNICPLGSNLSIYPTLPKVFLLNLQTDMLELNNEPLRELELVERVVGTTKLRLDQLKLCTIFEVHLNDLK
jgi:hypothetical protein